MKATDRKFALDLDARDPLARFRSQFVISDPNICYLDGNSLGRLPLSTIEAVNSFMKDEWGPEVVTGWGHWVDEAQPTGDLIGRATLGAAAGQVLACDTTSVNFYQLALAAISARPGRKTIITDAANFPTDRYILDGIAKQLGLKLVIIDNESAGSAEHERITIEILAPYLNEDVALVTLEVIQYRSGARNDIKSLTDLVRKHGAFMLWDASHAVGAIEMDFDKNGVDIAVGCTYKYGNSGPGAPAWLYVNKKVQAELQVPIQGWFSQGDQFAMGADFERAEGIRGFQIASPSLIGLRCIKSAFSMIEEAGIGAISEKAAIGTEMMIQLYDAWLAELGFTLLTSRNPQERGGHISIGHPDAARICVALREFADVIPDYRTPNSIRLAIAPLPTSYVEVWDGFARIRDLVTSRQYEKIEKNRFEGHMSENDFDSALTYTSYLAIDKLLELQNPLSEGPEHDEMLFIIIHQSYELWFKQLIHEFNAAGKALESGDTHRSLAILGRIRTILKVCVTQVDILETMTPLQFNAFRGYLSSSSGFQSAQFRKVEALLGRRDSKMAAHLPLDVQAEIKEIASRNSIWDSTLAYLAKRGHKIPVEILNRDKSTHYQSVPRVIEALLEVHRSDPESAMVCERLMDIDEGLQEWRYRHVKMVERTIGQKSGTGGSDGVKYLDSTLFNPVFKDLWDIRSQF